jgi:hypothetical protein
MTMHNLTVRVHKIGVLSKWKPELNSESRKYFKIKDMAVYRRMKSEIKRRYIYILTPHLQLSPVP